MPIQNNNSDDINPSSDDECFSSTPQGMTLEAVIDTIGEFEHLNELVTLYIEKSGGLKSIDQYFKIVTPILDLLEVEIRVRYVPRITKKEMKLIIQDWIDKEIADLKKTEFKSKE
ncbi:MAG: hypothetical protein ABR887_01280 [Methanoregulaceae archaeon]|jgi:hypothetical protein